jgi:hypothetical protein
MLYEEKSGNRGLAVLLNQSAAKFTILCVTLFAHERGVVLTTHDMTCCFLLLFRLKTKTIFNEKARLGKVWSRAERFFLVPTTYPICPNQKIYNMTTTFTKWPQNIPNGNKIDQMPITYTNIFHCKILQNQAKLLFWVWKYSIWQPWFSEQLLKRNVTVSPKERRHALKQFFERCLGKIFAPLLQVLGIVGSNLAGV